MKHFYGIILWTAISGCVDFPRGTNGSGNLLAPVALGTAIFREATDVALTIEFQTSVNCHRITPLDTFRFTLAAKNDSGGGTVLLDQFITQKTLLFRAARLNKGRYEAMIYHQDKTAPLSKKTFSINESSPLLLMAVPCLLD